jgi:hypothetical protein
VKERFPDSVGKGVSSIVLILGRRMGELHLCLHCDTDATGGCTCVACCVLYALCRKNRCLHLDDAAVGISGYHSLLIAVLFIIHRCSETYSSDRTPLCSCIAESLLLILGYETYRHTVHSEFISIL